MNKKFCIRLFGYRKKEVQETIREIITDYEEELGKKKDRMQELNEDNRKLRSEVIDLNKKLDQYTEQEKSISNALIEAEKHAKIIIKNAQLSAKEELDKIHGEKNKWDEKVKVIRSEILEFDQGLVDIVEKFRDEINFYTAKEISQTILVNNLDYSEKSKVEENEIKKVIA